MAFDAPPPTPAYMPPSAAEIEKIPPEILKVHRKLENDLEYFSKRVLKVKTKDPKKPIANLEFNFVQKYIHERTEAHLKKHGRIRIIIIKGRQQGASTYITARFYHKALMKQYSSVYILSHEVKSTKILVDKVYTYYTGAPDVLKPTLTEDNAQSLELPNGSNYGIGTATSKGTGRSGTNLYFHGSEPAHYPEGENVQAGALQTVPPGAGSEVFLETTCNGMNWFYDFYLDAKAGKNPYEVIFIPWYWSEEYRAPVPENFRRTPYEEKLVIAYDLDDAQLCFRREKIGELRSRKDVTNPEKLFKQEYPFTEEEAFQASGDSFFDSTTVEVARKTKVEDYGAPVIIGCDPSRLRDRFVISVRRGREFTERHVLDGMDHKQAAAILIRVAKRTGAVKGFIDRGHFGIAIHDELRYLGWGNIFTAVDFGSGSSDPAYADKRTEMYFTYRDWMEDGPVCILDDDDAVRDIMSIPDPGLPSSNGVIKLPDKEQVKKKLGRSPDIADADCLTFAFPVSRKAGMLRSSSQGVQVQTRSALSTSRTVNTHYQSNKGDGESAYGQDYGTYAERQGRSIDLRKDWEWGGPDSEDSY